jgi:two-component system response regulator (stage 0 sporulation protein F)
MIKILAVDDEPGICHLIKETFGPIGFTVLSAYNGQDALTLIKKENPKLVFLDIRMLGMSGLDVLKEIKRIDKSIKVVMLTVMSDEATKQKAKELGADDFVTKPFMSDHLEEVARREIADLLKERPIAEPKILVVDDEQEVCEKMAELISRHFVSNVDTALNGREALDKLRKDKFDLVVLDIRMPGLSGIDVIKEAVKFTPETKILAVSAYDSQEVANEAIKYGAIDFIHKPQTVAGIERKVKDVLKKIGKYQPRKL